MMERFGYAAGVGIACATVTLAIYTGTLYGRHTAPEPCIANFARTIADHPFAHIHQETVDDTEIRIWFEGTDSEVKQSGRDWIQKLIDWVPKDGGENAFGTIVRGESFLTNDREYYVPKDCYADDLDSFRGPTLYKR